MMGLDGCALNSIDNDCFDAHGGEDYCRLNAYNKDNLLVGRLDYSIFRNQIHVSMLFVSEFCRRKKIGTKMMDELKKIYVDQKINIGSTTEDGTRFFEKYNKKRS
jgi:ribosomal protein S18 acetylase RimI-like enzyme